MDGEIQNEKSEGFGNDLAKKVMEATRAEIEKRIIGLVCPVHGEKPRWKSVKTTGTEADLEFECCCQELARMIEKTLK